MGTKISALVAGSTLSGSEPIPAVQSGVTVATTPALIGSYIGGAGHGLIATPWDIMGFQPERISANVLRIYPGYLTNGSNTPADVMVSHANIDINLTVNGANGLDTGTITTGQGYYIYIIKHLTTGTVAAIASTAIAYAGVTYPSGYGIALVRKLPFGFIYMSSGIPSFHLSNWPMPTVWLDDWDSGGTWDVVFNTDVSNVYTDFDCSAFVPDNSRLVWLQCELRQNGGAGDLYLQVYGNNAINKKVLSVNNANEVAMTVVPYRLNSTRHGLWKTTTTNVRAFIRPIGYEMTEFA